MADLNLYRQIIEDLLQEFHGYSSSRKRDNVESELILDRERDHYLWRKVNGKGCKKGGYCFGFTLTFYA